MSYKFSNVLRGGAVALFTAAAAQELSAQVVAPARPRGDSAMVRVFIAAKMDTISALMRALNHEKVGSPAWVELTAKMDSLVMSGEAGEHRFFFRQPDGSEARIILNTVPRGWIGFNAQGPRRISDDGEGITYLAYPTIISVDPNSPADRAGIVPGDVLIAFNGTDVVGHDFNMNKLFVPEKKIGVTVRRDGETKDYSLEIAKAPQAVESRRQEFNRVLLPVPVSPGAPGLPKVAVGQMRIDVDRGDNAPEVGARRVPMGAVMARGGAMPVRVGSVISTHGALGANASPVNADLAKVLKLEKGILINEAPEESPAYKGGVRVGDVIVSASGQTVTTLSELQDQIVSRFGDRSIVLQVMRSHKTVKLTVTW